ncbi:GNAT family N-acetyltransferase [Streptomyces sp. 2112.3]|uniref:GNAT family N-acetyltransferase n=1 Tax=unclassified Streptomyces TaxID=2593676 RepID=UPI0035238BDE
MLVHDRAGCLAARARVDRRSAVDVHPEHRGRGLGAGLLDWAQARARQAGVDGIVQTVPDADSGAVALLRSRGYEPLVTAWLLEFAMPVEPSVPQPPTGVVVRPFRVGDGPATHVLVQDAFDEWTHSDTGALDLYLRVGMTVRHSSTVFRKDLRAWLGCPRNQPRQPRPRSTPHVRPRTEAPVPRRPSTGRSTGAARPARSGGRAPGHLGRTGTRRVPDARRAVHLRAGSHLQP